MWNRLIVALAVLVPGYVGAANAADWRDSAAR
jgi:hypothetical protein